MKLSNQNTIAQVLRNQGVPEDEIERRLMVARMSTSGDYNPLSDTYTSDEENAPEKALNEPSEPSILPPLAQYQDIAKDEAKPVSSKPVETDADRSAKEKNLLPIDMYGEGAKRWAMAFSEAYQVSLDLVAATMLIGVGMAANRKATVTFGNYTNRPSLWIAIVAPSGYNKSEPIAKILNPLESINKELVEYTRKEFAKWKADGEKGAPPVKLKLIISDSTPEIRSELLSKNGLLILRDEIFGFLKDLNRYTQSGEVETLLSIWSSKSFSVDRKTSTSFYVENPFLSIIGGVQPELMADAFGGKNFEGSGFLARWLFLWPYSSRVPEDIVEDTISKDVENGWNGLIQNLWRMPVQNFRLNHEAVEVYRQYLRYTANIMNAEDCENGVRAMLAKMRIYAIRLALVIHLLRHGHKAPEEIDGYAMSASIKTCNAFELWNSKALRAIANTDAVREMSNADLLRELVARYDINNQSELARLIGKSQQYVSRILKE